MALLEVDDISIKFGGIAAVTDFTLTIGENEIDGLIGPNGAGKTTVFNMLTGVYTPNSGAVYFCGKNITGAKPYKIAKANIARTFQNIRLFKNLTVADNIKTSLVTRFHYSIFDSFFRLPPFFNAEYEKNKIIRELFTIFGLWEKRDISADALPYGEQRRLEMARALALSPKLLLLDEPAAGMNPNETKELTVLIKEIRDRFSLSILLIEHDMPLVMSLCDKITVLDYGKIIAVGDPEKIKNGPKVIEAYLGEEKNNAS